MKYFLLGFLLIGSYVFTFKFAMQVGYIIGRSDGYCLYSGKHTFDECHLYYNNKDVYP